MDGSSPMERRFEAPAAQPVVTKKIFERRRLEEAHEAAKNRAAEAAAQGLETQALDKDVELRGKRLRLFDARHDNTGALKGDYFGRELAQAFEATEFRKEADGSFAIGEKERGTHMLLVNMGELDRLNASGDHTSGDKGLELVAVKIENDIQAALLAMDASLAQDPQRLTAMYEVYRTAGNDFSVKLEGVSEEAAVRIQQMLSGPMDVSSKLPGEEPVPLTASRASLADVIGVWNRLKQESPGDFATFDAEERKDRIGVSNARELLQQTSDKLKVEARVNRMLEKIQAGDDAAAAVFYEQFQKKILGGLFSPEPGVVLEYDAVPPKPSFKARLKELGAFDQDPERQKAWRETLSDLTIRDARKLYESRRSSAYATDRKIADIAASQALKYRPNAEQVDTTAAGRAAPFEEPKATRGTELVAAKKSAYAEAEARAKAEGLACAEESLEPGCQALEDSRLELEIEQARRDTLTGLEQRGPLFETMEASLESGRPTGMVFIDMAFLKYFDKEGGSETGNTAIKKAAEVLDALSAEFGDQLRAYRIGGDEFALSLTGTDGETMRKVIDRLQELQREAGEIPLVDKKAAGAYEAQGLSFNFGVMNAESKESLKGFLKEKGIPLEHEGTPDETNELAEYLMRFADKQLEIQKGLNRFDLLLRERARSQDPSTGKYAQLLRYSAKAIFDEGSQKIEAWHAKLESATDKLAARREVDAEMLEYVIAKIRAKNAENQQYQQSIDKLIEERVRELFFDQKLRELESKIADLESRIVAKAAENLALQNQNEDLRRRIQALEGEKEQIASLRAQISGR